jgi:hypothetical protein
MLTSNPFVGKSLLRGTLEVPPVPGDFDDVVQLLLERTITVDETNIGFLTAMYQFLGLRLGNRFTDIAPWITMNNVVLIANQLQRQHLDNIDVVHRFIEAHMDVLVAQNRVRLLPVCYLIRLAKQVDPALLCLQICDPVTGKTALAKQITFKTLDVPDIRALVLDPYLELRSMREKFMEAYNEVAHTPPSILVEYQPDRPFDGIFNFLARQAGGNPHQAGLVTLEASSSQVGSVMRILDYDSNEYFATRDAAGQWIKFEFNQHRISLSGYSYKTHSVQGNGHSKSWRVDGTSDGMNWISIHVVTNTSLLLGYGAVYTVSFVYTDFFKIIRFTQTDTNSMNYNNFRVANIEFFGKLLSE